MVAMLVALYCQFRGAFMDVERLTSISGRAGLSMDPGAKVTYNGVEIGRVGKVEAFDVSGQPKAKIPKITLDVDPKYLKLIPQNMDASINATTVFGNKYIAFSSPKNPSPQRVNSSDVVDATHVTIEFNTLFETVVSVAQQVDPIKLNQTLTATAEASDGLGDRFGQAIVQGNQILGDLNLQMPLIRRDNQLLAGLSETYANAAPDLFDGLENAVATARTLNETAGKHRSCVDGGGRARQYRRRRLRTRRSLSRSRYARLDPHVAGARQVQSRIVLHDRQLQRRRHQSCKDPRRKRILEPGVGLVSRSRQPLRLSRQLAKGERARWSRGSARLLATRSRATCGRRRIW
jgi:virulence factor Mce-like protein